MSPQWLIKDYKINMRIPWCWPACMEKHTHTQNQHVKISCLLTWTFSKYTQACARASSIETHAVLYNSNIYIHDKVFNLAIHAHCGTSPYVQLARSALYNIRITHTCIKGNNNENIYLTFCWNVRLGQFKLHIMACIMQLSCMLSCPGDIEFISLSHGGWYKYHATYYRHMHTHPMPK